MPIRRSRTFFPQRRVARTQRMQWVRESPNNVAPANPSNIDLLALFRTQFGITANLPDIVVERLHLKVSCTYTITTAGANNGIAVAAWVDSKNQTIQSAVAQPYDQHFLIYDILYQTEQQLYAGAVGGTADVAYHIYDVKSKRKLRSIDETLWLQLQPVGAIVFTQYAYTMSLLLKF